MAPKYLIRRHGWILHHHALHLTSLLIIHQVLALGRLLHSHETLEPLLLIWQDRLVTWKKKDIFKYPVACRGKMKTVLRNSK